MLLRYSKGCHGSLTPILCCLWLNRVNLTGKCCEQICAHSNSMKKIHNRNEVPTQICFKLYKFAFYITYATLQLDITRNFS